MKLLVAISALAIVIGLLVGSYLFSPGVSQPASVGPVGGGFTLQSDKGKVSLADYKGKVVLLYFGYTYCPDICPTSLAQISSAFRALKEEELEQVQAIFISVDPERDTTKKLAAYAPFFHPKIVGVTGTKDNLLEITKRYSVRFNKAEGSTAADYLVDHTSLIFVLDKKGKVSALLPHAVSVDMAVATIRRLLAE